MINTKVNDKNNADKITRPIGGKLIFIITTLLLFSLGAITALVSVLVSNDLRVTAEVNNFTVNSRSAMEAETFLGTIRSNTLVLLETLDTADTGSSVELLAPDFFFEHNQQIGFIGTVREQSDGLNPVRNLANEKFFMSNELDLSIADGFLSIHEDALERACSGETLLINATSVLGVPTLALAFPLQKALEREAVIVFFSSNSLTESFASGANVSFMVNNEGDYIVHADFELIKAGVNARGSPLVTMALESADRARQTLYTDTDEKKYFGAFRKIAYANAVVITVIPYDIVFEGLVATTRRNIYLSGAVLFIAIVFVWFFSKTVSVPLKTLAAAARQIEGGNFELNLESKARDEVGLLTTSFQRMSNALEILGRFTYHEIAVRSMRGEIKPGGFPKHATVLFSDIRGFTKKSEDFTKVFGNDASDRIVNWLNEYLTRMIECVEKTRGVIDKFIGDAVMAHWGTAYSAGSPAKDAFNCVCAALLMRKATVELNKGRSNDDLSNPPIRIGCGINSGIITAGQLGSSQRMEYTVIGSPVNLANRTESMNKLMGTDILITDSTYNLTGDRFITEEMPSFKFKGNESPVRMFAVVNLKTDENHSLSGPKTLTEVRELLGISAPDFSRLDLNKERKEIFDRRGA